MARLTRRSAFLLAKAKFDEFVSGLATAGAMGKDFASDQQAVLRGGIARTVQIAGFFERMLKSNDFGRLDDFFFSRETLPPGGKEYWFIVLVSTTGDRAQFVLTFGRSDSKTMVNDEAAGGGKVAAVGWLYSAGRKRVFLEKSAPLACRKGLLKARGFEFSGAYPDFKLSAGRGTRVKLSKPKRGVSYEAQKGSVSNFGIGMLNMYLDAKGVVGGKPFHGVSYVQKVVVVAPFIPWNWVRLTFPDRSVIDFFEVRLDRNVSGSRVFQSATYRPPSGIYCKLSNLKLSRLESDRWLLSGDGIAVYMKTYAFKPFVLKGRGEFHYDEYMVECTDFVFRGKTMSGGVGIIEDAYGFMV